LSLTFYLGRVQAIAVAKHIAEGWEEGELTESFEMIVQEVQVSSNVCGIVWKVMVWVGRLLGIALSEIVAWLGRWNCMERSTRSHMVLEGEGGARELGKLGCTCSNYRYQATLSHFHAETLIWSNNFCIIARLQTDYVDSVNSYTIASGSIMYALISTLACFHSMSNYGAPSLD
jgi:hypothetical protein